MRTGFQNFSLGETQLIRTQSSTRPLSEQNAVNDLLLRTEATTTTTYMREIISPRQAA